MRTEILEAVAAVLDHGRFVLGPEVDEFEQAFAARVGADYAVGVGSGTDALVLALRALGIGPGDEVLTVANSFIATAEAIVAVGAVPRFVDVGPDENVDPDLLDDAWSGRTGAVLPVHLRGRPAAIERIVDWAKVRGVRVVEDCAQAIGSTVDGAHVGTFGDAGCFSMNPLKTLGACGEAGVVVASDPEVRDRLRALRQHGLRDRDTAIHWSSNARLDTLQAAILLVKLRRLDDAIAARRRAARRYDEDLAGLDLLLPPAERPGEHVAPYSYVVMTEDRDRFVDHLREGGVDALVHYPTPIHLQPLPQRRVALPRTEWQSERIVSLPLRSSLSYEEQTTVIERVREHFR